MKAIIASPLPPIRVGLGQKLRGAGYALTKEVATGMDAVTRFIKDGADVVFVDANQDDMTGLETCQQIRIKDKNVRIVIFGNDPQDQFVLRAIALGNVVFMQLPITPDKVAAALKAPLTCAAGGDPKESVEVFVVCRLANVRFQIKRALAKYGCDPMMFDDGNEIFTLLPVKKPRMIIYDEDNQFLPLRPFLEKMENGNKLADYPVIVIGQNLKPSIHAELRRYGIDYVMKIPFDDADLNVIVKALCS